MNWYIMGTIVLLITSAADFAWSRYTLDVTGRRPHSAAGWSAVIIVLGAGNVVAYIHDWRMVIFAAVGAYLGTFLAVRRHGRA